MRSSIWVVAFVILVGMVATVYNLDLPPVRHSVLAIQTTFALHELPLTLENFIRSKSLTWGKPLGPSLVNFPFFLLLGKDFGFHFSSFVSTLLLMLLVWLWHGEATGKRPSWIFLILVFYNPLFIYQFWALGPDAIGAAFFIASFHLLEKWLKSPRPGLWVVAGYFFAIYATILVRTHALILPLLHLAYWLGGIRDGTHSASAIRPRLKPLLAGYAVLGALVILARLDLNVTLSLSSSGGAELDEYGSFLSGGLPWNDYVLNLLELSLFLLISYSFCLWLLFKPMGHEGLRWRLALPVLAYLATLLPYKFTYHNLRYFLPISPFLALWISQSFQSLPRSARGALGVATVLASSAGIILANFDRVTDLGRDLVHRHYQLDNFRMFSRLEHRKALDLLSADVLEGRPCYVVTTYYGGESYFGFFEKIGYVPAGKRLSYATGLSGIKSKEPLTLWYIDHDSIDVAGSVRAAFPERRITALGHDVYRLD